MYYLVNILPMACRSVLADFQFSLISRMSLFNRCWCGDRETFDATKVPESECNSPCAGDPELTCGGELTANVYEVY